MEHDGKSYEESLQSTRSFYNPTSTEHLAQSLGLDVMSSGSHSLLKTLRYSIFIASKITQIGDNIFLSNTLALLSMKKIRRMFCARRRATNGPAIALLRALNILDLAWKLKHSNASTKHFTSIR